MKFFLIIFAISGFRSVIVAQENQIPIGKITYLQQNFIQTPATYNGPVTLLFNRTRSVFIHHAAQGQDSVIQDSGLAQPMSIPVDKEGFPLYKLSDQKIILSKIFCKESVEHCIVSDTIDPIDWTFHPEKRRFGQMECRRATCNYWGRQYEAWYAPDIPISNGPYRFGGLPGLIIEIKSTDNKVNFIFQSLEIPYRGTEKINNPSGMALKESYIDFRKRLVRFAKNAEKEMRARGFDMSATPDETIEILENK